MDTDGLRYLPDVAIDDHRTSGSGTPDHPMRVATRRAAGLDPAGWTPELRHDVERYFDALAPEWQARSSPQRLAVATDALTRGLASVPGRRGLAIEVGSGTGAYSAMVAARFGAEIGRAHV